MEVLSGFAGKYGITYPLLSDEGSGFIRELGILNEQAAENVFGIPHPGVYVLDADGRVARKTFYESYRERDTGTGLLTHLLGISVPPKGPADQVAGDGVRVSAWLDIPDYAWGQRAWLTVEVEIDEGLHVYGRPIPEGYYPLEVEVEPMERVVVGEPGWPATTPFRIQGLVEQFHVYEGIVRVSLPISFMVVDAGDLLVKVRVSYQACSAIDCLPPAEARFELPIAERPLVERPTPKT